MSREKVAYIAKIAKTEPIEGKDRIQYCYIKSEDSEWGVIASKELKEGDTVIYIEYDTIILEDQQWAEFLRKRCYSPKYKGFKISAMSMAGKISYGLIVTFQETGITGILVEGYDVSKLLGVKAIDDAEEFESNQKKPELTKFQKFVKKYFYFIWKSFYYRKPEKNDFPSEAAIKTDETRGQNLTYMFNPENGFYGKNVYVTEKLDGQSVTFTLYKKRFKIASRNITKYDQPIKKAIKELIPKNEQTFGKNSEFIALACKYNVPKMMSTYVWTIINGGLTLQGEMCGPGIQGNKLQLKEKDMYLFNMFDPIERRYFRFETLQDFIIHSRMKLVPLKEFTTFDWNSIEEMETYVKEDFEASIYPKGQPREGLVFRVYNPRESMLPVAQKNMNGCCSWKIINPDFVLQNK